MPHPTPGPPDRIGRLTGRGRRLPDVAFRRATGAAAALVVAMLVLLAVLLIGTSSEAWLRFGVLRFVTGVVWDPIRAVYGALPYIVGTLATSLLALVIAGPVAVLTAVYLAEWSPRGVAAPLTFVVELLAAIPSVVIGLWGVFVLGPVLRATIETWLVAALGFVPFLAGPPAATGLFVASVILAIMILPTIVTLAREVIAAVPQSHREAMLALGATRWEVVRHVVVPAARSGIAGAVILGLGRALGETMAVTMVIGNGDDIPRSLFGQANTIASKIATSFNEAQIGIQTASLLGLGVVLLGITVVLNVAARWAIAQAAAASAGR